jgi:hypothetical protein
MRSITSRFRKNFARGAMLLALVAAGVAMTPQSLSAKIIWFAWTCNSDGHYHLQFVSEGSSNVQEWVLGECGGPRMNISPGAGFEVIFSEKTQVSPAGMTFLNTVEQRGDMGTPRRAREAGAEKPTDRPETIYLRPSDVRPVLAALLTQLDRGWNKGTTYWCNDGTTVAYISSCRNYGGYTPPSAVRPGAAGPPSELCIFDRWGRLAASTGGECALPAGKEPDCLRGGGTLSEINERMYCTQARAGNAAGPARSRPLGGAFGRPSQTTEISQPVATEIRAILERNRFSQETAGLMVGILLDQSGGSFPGRWQGGGFCWNDDGTYYSDVPCPKEVVNQEPDARRRPARVSRPTRVSVAAADQLDAFLDRNALSRETAGVLIRVLLKGRGGSFQGYKKGGGWCWNDDGTFHGSLPCPKS